MGWGGGQDLLITVWNHVRDYVHDDEMRHELLKKLIKAFKKHDMDDCSDIEQSFPEAKAVLKELYPHWYEYETTEEN